MHVLTLALSNFCLDSWNDEEDLSAKSKKEKYIRKSINRHQKIKLKYCKKKKAEKMVFTLLFFILFALI